MQKKILVVDDDEDILLLVSTYLKEFYSVVQTSYVSDALYIFQREKIDLLIVDYLMSPRNGMYLVKEIRKIDARTPVVIISGYTTAGLEQDLATYKIASVMPKPLEKDELLSCVESLI